MNNNIKKTILELLPTERENAVHQIELAKLARTTCAAVKKNIQRLRSEDNKPIMSTNEGYWITDNKEEFLEFYYRERKQALTRLETIEAAARGFD